MIVDDNEQSSCKLNEIDFCDEMASQIHKAIRNQLLLKTFMSASFFGIFGMLIITQFHSKCSHLKELNDLFFVFCVVFFLLRFPIDTCFVAIPWKMKNFNFFMSFHSFLNYLEIICYISFVMIWTIGYFKDNQNCGLLRELIKYQLLISYGLILFWWITENKNKRSVYMLEYQ